MKRHDYELSREECEELIKPYNLMETLKTLQDTKGILAFEITKKTVRIWENPDEKINIILVLEQLERNTN